MARDKKWKASESLDVPDRLAILCEVAGDISMPDDALDDELEDACNSNAKMALRNIQSATLLEKLEFLYVHGFEIGRLEQLIRELSMKTED